MRSQSVLKQELLARDGRSYPAYRDVKGQWDFGDYVLSIDHVQSDPYASPSDLSIRIAHPNFPAHLYETKACRIALQDALLRHFLAELKGIIPPGGKGGKIEAARVSQEVIERSACRIDPENGSLIFRFNIGFPAAGRRILSRKLVTVLFDQLPVLVHDCLLYNSLSLEFQQQLQKVYELTCDQEEIRRQLEARNLLAFVANGSILPRQSGVSEKPMAEAIAFQSPRENEITLDLPYAGKVSGMALPEGIVMIIGGGYHGKSTLLNALESGINNHIEKDGREFVVTRADGMKIRSEDGRCVHHDDISAFINHLPSQKSVQDFVSEDASGSTSQAANVVEAIESGSHLLLIDEDTSATNFMIRDDLMAQVVAAKEEPIIPFVARIEDLKNKGVSTILVAGSSGAYFPAADEIIQMDEYKPVNVTALAKEKAAALHTAPKAEYPALEMPGKRIILPNPRMDDQKLKVKTTQTDTISVAREPIDVRALEQLVDSQQAAAIGKMIVYAQKNLIDGNKTLDQVADELIALADENGPAFFGKGNLAVPRKQELMAAFNRMRSQDFRQENPAQ